MLYLFDRKLLQGCTLTNEFKDEQVIAASQDFGSDLEHAESLLKKFTEFQNDLFNKR